ncbi:unnamed protein product [Umbelopsis sp. WA50703]
MRQFIRPKLEYDLATSKLLVAQVKIIDAAQDTCLRMIFRPRNTTSTSFFRHLTDLLDMQTRLRTLPAKFSIRAATLPIDTLFYLMPRLHNFLEEGLLEALYEIGDMNNILCGAFGLQSMNANKKLESYPLIALVLNA